MKTLEQLLPHCSYRSHQGVYPAVSSIEYDSRTVQEHSLFVARRGQNSDGHAFIAKAISGGARTIVCEYVDSTVEIPDDVALVIVEDSAIALAQLSHAFYDFPTRHLRVIGITGTNGKTTCAYLLSQILSAAGEITGMIGTTGNYIGKEYIPTTFTTPEAPELCALFQRMKQAGVGSVVMEVSSHALVLRRVHGVQFSAALFTNLTQDHLDFHGTMEEYALAKKMLFDMIDNTALAVVNGDSPYTPTIVRDCKAALLRVGREPANDWRISNEQMDAFSSRFCLNATEFSMSLIGSFNIENAALCVCCAQALGLSEKFLVDVLPSLHGAPGRMKRFLLGNGAVGIIDYAHTPDALERALLNAKELLPSGGRLWSVFGCGGNRDSAKRPLMGAISERIAHNTIITSDNPRLEDPQSIIDDIMAGMTNRATCSVIPDRRAAIQYAVQQAQQGDIILLAGKGHEEYQIIGKEKLHFSDEEELCKA